MKTIEILHKWEEYFNNQNLKDILNLYHPKSSLIPTFSSSILFDQNDIKEYFIFLFQEQQGSVNIQNESIVEQKIVEKVYLSIGNYIFYLSQGREYPARFSFILDISLENPIKHHHSSPVSNPPLNSSQSQTQLQVTPTNSSQSQRPSK